MRLRSVLMDCATASSFSCLARSAIISIRTEVPLGPLNVQVSLRSSTRGLSVSQSAASFSSSSTTGDSSLPRRALASGLPASCIATASSSATRSARLRTALLTSTPMTMCKPPCRSMPRFMRFFGSQLGIAASSFSVERRTSGGDAR
jgi:hypothetical protein